MKKLLFLVMIGAVSILVIGSIVAMKARPTAYQLRTGSRPLTPAVVISASSGWQTLGGEAGNSACLGLDSDYLGNIYAGTGSGVYRWDLASTSWSQLSSENSRALVYDKTRHVLYSATDTAVKKWDGSAWTQLGDSFTGGNIFSLAVDPSGNLYVGGTFKGINDVTRGRIAIWYNGTTSWSYIENGSIVGDCCYSIFYSFGTIYAGGDRGVFAYRSQWAQMKGVPDGKYVTLDHFGNLYATDGYFIYFWKKGQLLSTGTFSKVPADYPWGAAYEGNTNIRKIFFGSPNVLYVGGQFNKFSGNTTTNYAVAKLTGAMLNPAGGDTLLGTCFSLIFSNNYLYAGGEFGGENGGLFKDKKVNIVRGRNLL